MWFQEPPCTIFVFSNNEVSFVDVCPFPLSCLIGDLYLEGTIGRCIDIAIGDIAVDSIAVSKGRGTIRVLPRVLVAIDSS